jgi:hypothetical protein
VAKKPGTFSTTEPRVEPGDQGELAAVAGEVAAELDQPTAPTPDTPEDELVDLAVEKLDEFAKRPEEVERVLALLTEQELADLLELGFGLVADQRGPHWEITSKRSLRIAKWLKLSLEKHGEVLKWVASFLPELVTALLLTYEIWTRVKLEGELKAKKKEADAAAAH